MSDKYDIYDVPPTALPPGIDKTFASDLTRRTRWMTWGVAGFLAVLGGALAYHWANPAVFARFGALISMLGLLVGAYQLRWAYTMDRSEKVALEIFTKIEHDKLGGAPEQEVEAKAIANKRIQRVLPMLKDGVQRELLAQNLTVTAIGTVIWGFGDLIPF